MLRVPKPTSNPHYSAILAARVGAWHGAGFSYFWSSFMPASDPLDAVLALADARLDASREALFALLAIPSISAQPAHKADCQRGAEWVCEQLIELGFEASLRPTPGHPVVLGHYGGPQGANVPHVLFYGHYDVQPPDPLELWNSPPFEPQLVDGPHGKRFVARGAVDDKGQFMMFLEALRAWKETTGAIPVRLTVLIEGEEEVGSVNLDPFLKANAAELACDIALISDTGMWDVNTPAVTTRLRGMVYTQVTLRGPNKDLHSGLYGGSALNPINALTRILGDLTDSEGHIQIPGFYDGVSPISNALAVQWDALAFDEAARAKRIGAAMGLADRGYQRHLGRLYRARSQNRDRFRSIGESVLSPGRSAGTGGDIRGVPAFREQPASGGGNRHVREFLHIAGDRGCRRQSLGAHGTLGPIGRIWQAGGADGLRRVNPGCGIFAAHPGGG